MAGVSCWIPIYPIDVVKTVIQNTQGEDKEQGFLQVASELYENHGPGVFYDGIAPRLLRQAVNHAVTFGVYDALYHNLLV
jgi:solute carrier family 25 carnitine/acylcarnitine transporter 20/29